MSCFYSTLINFLIISIYHNIEQINKFSAYYQLTFESAHVQFGIKTISSIS